jgi:hypothetical protein
VTSFVEDRIHTYSFRYIERRIDIKMQSFSGNTYRKNQKHIFFRSVLTTCTIYDGASCTHLLTLLQCSPTSLDLGMFPQYELVIFINMPLKLADYETQGELADFLKFRYSFRSRFQIAGRSNTRASKGLTGNKRAVVPIMRRNHIQCPRIYSQLSASSAIGHTAPKATSIRILYHNMLSNSNI